MLLPANLVKCWCLFEKTNQRNPTLEHVHVESPKKIKYQLGQLDTILFWPELKQNKNTGNLTGEPTEKAQSNRSVIQDLHHPPLDCMLLMKTELFQPQLCIGLLQHLRQQGWRRARGAFRTAHQGWTRYQERYERESATQVTSMLLQFNCFQETCSEHQVRCLDSVSQGTLAFRHSRHFFKLALQQHLERRLQKLSQKLILALLANLLTLPQWSRASNKAWLREAELYIWLLFWEDSEPKPVTWEPE